MGKDKGYILINRSAFSGILWNEERTYSRAEAFIDLIQLARYADSDTRSLIGGKLVSWGQGQIPASNRFLQDRWKWSNTKVKAFIDFLVTEGEIKISQTSGQTVITVLHQQNNEKLTHQKRHPKSHLNPQQESISADSNDSKNDTKSDAETTEKRRGNDETVNKGVNKGVNKDVNKVITEMVLPWQSDGFINAWNKWRAYKNDEWKFKYKSTITEQAALNELKTLSEGIEEVAIKIIDQSIAKTWKGFYELKDKQNEHTNKRAGKPVVENNDQPANFYKGM